MSFFTGNDFEDVQRLHDYYYRIFPIISLDEQVFYIQRILLQFLAIAVHHTNRPTAIGYVMRRLLAYCQVYNVPVLRDLSFDLHLSWKAVEQGRMGNDRNDPKILSLAKDRLSLVRILGHWPFDADQAFYDVGTPVKAWSFPDRKTLRVMADMAECVPDWNRAQTLCTRALRELTLANDDSVDNMRCRKGMFSRPVVTRALEIAIAEAPVPRPVTPPVAPVPRPVTPPVAEAPRPSLPVQPMQLVLPALSSSRAWQAGVQSTDPDPVQRNGMQWLNRTA